MARIQVYPTGGSSGGSITGSGTNGQVALWSGASSLTGNAGVAWDSTATNFFTPGGWAIVAGPTDSWTNESAISGVCIAYQIAVVAGSTTNLAARGIGCTVLEGSNNRRISMFVDDTTGTAGINTTASSGVPVFHICIGGASRLSITSGTVNIPGLTASRVLTTDGSSNLAASSVTTTTLAFLDATSSIQGQLNAKLPLSGGTMSDSIAFTGNRWIGAAGSNTFGVRTNNLDRILISTDGFVNMAYGMRTIYATTNTANPPTNAEMVTAFGAAATFGSGGIGVLNDAGGGTNEYLCFTDGSNWWYIAGTKGA